MNRMALASRRKLLPALGQMFHSSSYLSNPHPSEGFLTGTSSVYIDEMFAQWKKDPSSVHVSWNVYFRNVEAGAPPGAAFTPPPTIQSSSSTPVINKGTASSSASVRDAVAVVHLVRAYQVRGTELAQLDPLKLQKIPVIPELQIENYGFTEKDMDRTIDLSGLGTNVKGALAKLSGTSTTLRELIAQLKQIYCSSIGVEYMHIGSREECNWIRERIEVLPAPLSKEEKSKVLERLNFSETFEYFLSQKFNTAKRFGVEGAESVIPGMKAMTDRATELGIDHIVIGMAHRGRLNVLTNVIRKPLELIFKEFAGTHFNMEKLLNIDVDGDGIADWSGSGDVKYHLGTNFTRKYPDGREVHLSLMANPSHLEAVNPLVVGKARAKMTFSGDEKGEGKKILPIMIHGDAAVAGQGIVYETFTMSQLNNYKTGGSIHIIINNQVGFTTDPSDSRSTKYCSDIGKTFECPIFHVNADDPEAVVRVFNLAVEFRQKFHRDVVIDLIGYRRHGHNELDQPMFTQPAMYKVIAKHPTALRVYQKKLVDEKSFTAEEVKKIEDDVWKVFETAYANSKDYVSKKEEWFSSRWKGFKGPGQLSRIRSTGVDANILRQLGESISVLPSTIKPHRMVQKIFEAKKASIDASSGLDWATCEALAFGTLLQEGNHVRISGQDVERGTFSHRHAVVTCNETNQKYTPLKHIPAVNGIKPALFAPCNSPLSEFGVLGFELGYSLENPNQLNIWEAQFGDFVNGAQIIIDNFLSSGESKWMRQSGLVMLLPHGYDGQGAEHSSCRIERFLQSCDDDPDSVPPMAHEIRQQIQVCNWQIVNCTTPANYYHVLRRQVHREFRKPLIVAAPKALLKLKACSSTIDDMGPGTKFKRVIEDPSTNLVSDDKIRKVAFCSGKIYYELNAEREKKGIKDIVLVRLEQIAPFPFDKVAEQVKKYPNAVSLWVQEEPKNMGAYSYIYPRFRTATAKLNGDKRSPKYVGRLASAATATGKSKNHTIEQQLILDATLS